MNRINKAHISTTVIMDSMLNDIESDDINPIYYVMGCVYKVQLHNVGDNKYCLVVGHFTASNYKDEFIASKLFLPIKEGMIIKSIMEYSGTPFTIGYNVYIVSDGDNHIEEFAPHANSALRMIS